MTIRSVYEVREVEIRQLHCDGPRHVGATLMSVDALTLVAGYGSDFDGDNYHFCSLVCLDDWARARRNAPSAP